MPIEDNQIMTDFNEFSEVDVRLHTIRAPLDRIEHVAGHQQTIARLLTKHPPVGIVPKKQAWQFLNVRHGIAPLVKRDTLAATDDGVSLLIAGIELHGTDGGD